MTTIQTIFDIVTKGIISQGGPSYDDSSEIVSCCYRGPDGRKCAAGWLIPDNMFDPAMNNMIISEVPEMLPDKFRDELSFIRQLQRIHDDAQMDTTTDEGFMQLWRQNMAEFAKDKGLEFNP